MKLIYMLVEGETEEMFVKDILAFHLADYQLKIHPIVVETSRKKSGEKYTGGEITYHEFKKQIFNLLNDSRAICVTTIIDFYKIPKSFYQDKKPLNDNTSFNKVEFLEKIVASDINNHRFLPYFSLHELEALLFVSPDDSASWFAVDVQKISKIKQSFRNPEEINLDNPPSKRIYDIYPSYGKEADFVLAIIDVPITTIRAECPHFNQWLTKLEALGISP